MTNYDLVEKLKADSVLKTPVIIKAFEKIDRADFILPADSAAAYADYPLPIGDGQTISQPTTVAFMLELLKPRAGEKILDVGTGSGWTMALLAEIVGPGGMVLGVEIVPALVKFGQKNLSRYNFGQARIFSASEKLGLPACAGGPEQAPFDKILVSAAAAELPKELINQLKIGGRLVIPVRNSIWQIDKISDDEIKKKEFFGFVFVPLINP